MEVAAIQAQKRKPGGRHANERTRRDGFVPAVIYGHGEDPETVALSRHDLEIALGHHTHVVNLKLDGADRQLLLKAVQYDHLQTTPIHVDLMRVDVSERVPVKVTIELRGTPKGAKEGGTLVTLIPDLNLECPLMQIPSTIRVDVSHLEMNQSVHIRELVLPPDVKALHHPEEIVCILHPPRGVEGEGVVPPVEGASAEPEVIAKGKEEKEGAAE